MPKIIPARQCKHAQPLLNFSKSKILTLHAYTEGCEHVLAQKEATEAEARRMVVERLATKESRPKEKEDHQVEVMARKEA